MKVHLIAESVLRFSPIGIVDNTSTHGNTLHTLLKTATNPGNTPTATSCDDSGVRKTLLSPICGKSIVLLELYLLSRGSIGVAKKSVKCGSEKK